MRKIEQERSAGIAPIELADRFHPTWRDPAAFHRWCLEEGIAPMPEQSGGQHPTTRWARFDHARRQWAQLHDIGGPNGKDELTAMGVDFADSLDRARARAQR